MNQPVKPLCRDGSVKWVAVQDYSDEPFGGWGGEENNKRNGERYRGDDEGFRGSYTLKLLFNQLFSVPSY